MKKEKKTLITDYLLECERQSSTASNKKIKNYFYSIVKNENFIQEIKRLREKYCIPLAGFKHSQPSLESSKDPSPSYQLVHNRGIYIDIEGFVIPPKSYDYLKYRKLREEIYLLCKELNLYPLDFEDIIALFIFYDYITFPLFNNAYNLCRTQNLKSHNEDGDLIGSEADKDEDEFYPIALRISPYASLRDIIEYIKAMYKPTIKPMLDYYKKEDVKLGKIRLRKKQERNDYIWKNRNLPAEKLADLVNKKFYPKGNGLFYFDTNRIISLEKKRRSEK